MTCPIQNSSDLHDAFEWLNAAVSIGERALTSETSPEVRDEWILALDAKRRLLKQLEHLGTGRELLGEESWARLL